MDIPPPPDPPVPPHDAAPVPAPQPNPYGPYAPPPPGSYGPPESYGPYGPYGPYGYYPPPPLPPYSGAAIASFVVAMSCVPVLGVVLGVVGLRGVRRKGHRGRGFAIAGIVLNGLWTAVLAAVITLGSLGYLDDDSTGVQDLRAGDCFTDPGGLGGLGFGDIDVMPCSQPHEGEAYAVVTGASLLTDDGGYPGSDLLGRFAQERCAWLIKDYVADSSKLPESVGIHYYTPSGANWSAGDHNVVCVLGDSAGPLTGSLKSGSSSDDASV